MATLLLMRYVAWLQYMLFGDDGIFDIDKNLETKPKPDPEVTNEAYFSDSVSTDPSLRAESPALSATITPPPAGNIPPPTSGRITPPPSNTGIPSTDLRSPSPAVLSPPIASAAAARPTRKVGPSPIPTATEVALRARARARAVTTAMLAAGAASFGYSRRRRNDASPGLRATNQQVTAPPSALSYAAMTSSTRNINSMGLRAPSHIRNHTGSDSLHMNVGNRRTSLSLSESRRGSLASLIGGGDIGYVSMMNGGNAIGAIGAGTGTGTDIGSDEDQDNNTDRESSVNSNATDISLAAQFIDESYSNTPVHIGHMQYEKWMDLYSEEFAGSPSDIFHEAFSDEFIRSIHAERESKELVITEWEVDDDDMIISNQPTTWKRKLEFITKIKDAPSFLPNTTKIKEVQRFRFYGSSKLVYDVAISTPNVKFLAHVQTLQRNTFVQDEKDPQKCLMTSTIAFKWPKKSLLKKFIISHSTSEAKKSMQVWGKKMHERLEIARKQKQRESLSTDSNE